MQMFPHAFVDFLPGEFQLWEDTKTKEIEDLKAELRVKSLGISKRLQLILFGLHISVWKTTLKGGRKMDEFLNFFPNRFGQRTFFPRPRNASCLGVTWRIRPQTEMDER